MPRGGKRDGSGRPQGERRRVGFWVNPEEHEALKVYLKKIQKEAAERSSDVHTV